MKTYTDHQTYVQNGSLVFSPDGEAKVSGPNGAGLVLVQEEEVVGLDVTVDDALGVTL